MKELAKALNEARANMGKLLKDAKNPHFKSKYATLKAVIEVAQKPFADAGLCVFEYVTSEGETPLQHLDLIHTESGEQLTSEIPLLVRDAANPQQVGSAQTYARRYLWTTAAGLAPEDDDGQAAAQGKTQAVAKPNGKAVDQTKAKSAVDSKKRTLAETLGSLGIDKGEQAEWIALYCDHYAESHTLNEADVDALLLEAQKQLAEKVKAQLEAKAENA